MADLQPALLIEPAPYLASTADLLLYVNNCPHSVFYRMGDASFKGRPVDIFAAGNFNSYDVPWSATKSSHRRHDSVTASQLTDTGGKLLVGYISYEANFHHEKRWRELPTPADGYVSRFLDVTCWYKADHTRKTGTIYRSCCAGRDEVDSLKEVLAKAGRKQTIRDSKAASEADLNCLRQYGELSESGYCARIRSILQDIAAGRYYELNFTQRFRRTSVATPLNVFLEVFHRYQPARGFYCDFNDEVIGSCSPELFLRKMGQDVYTRPIKGSMVGTLAAQDMEKLYAEHVMVVDLARNDFGRISNLSSVSVPEFQTVNEFGGLQHLESLVCGKTSLFAPEILDNLLPAASISGAPKVEVVKAIAEYEASPRGLYTGVCGIIGPYEDMDLNVAIRTFRSRKEHTGWNYEFGAGGAIVADSVPEQEYIECLRKAWPIMSAISACE